MKLETSTLIEMLVAAKDLKEAASGSSIRHVYARHSFWSSVDADRVISMAEEILEAREAALAEPKKNSAPSALVKEGLDRSGSGVKKRKLKNP